MRGLWQKTPSPPRAPHGGPGPLADASGRGRLHDAALRHAPMALGRVPTIIGIVIVGVLLAALIAVPLIDWNDHRDWIAEQVSKRTGRTFQIAGPLDIKLDTTPRIRAERVTFGNAAWGSEPAMVYADVVDFRISVPQLLFRQLYFPEINLTRPHIVLERNPADGAANWELNPKKPSTGGKPPVIGKLTIDKGKLRYRDRAAGTDIVADLGTKPPASATEETTLTIAAAGQFRKAKFDLEGRIGALLALRDKTKPYPLNIHGRVGGSEASINGYITDVTRFAELDLQVDLKGADLAKLHAIIKLPFPPTPPYTLTGKLARKGTLWQLRGLNGTIGDSDIAGDFSVDTASERAKIVANLSSKRLDFDDIAGFIGAPPQTGPGETAAPEQKRAAARLEQRPRVLPNKPYNLAAMRKVDAQVDYTARRVKAPSLPIESIVTHFRLENGVLRFTPLRVGLARGELEMQLYMNAREDPMRVVADMTARRVALGKLFPKIKLTRDSQGRFGGRLHVETRGNSIADMAAGADGALALAMNTGEVSNLLLELAGLDALEALKFWLGGDKRVPIRCAVADFALAKGHMQSRTLVFDTTDTKLTGDGSIDLGKEALDLTINAKPKDRSILSARSPLYVRGTFKKPEVGVEKRKLARKLGEALALGAAAPLAALIPLVETGEGKDSNCAALIAETQRRVRDETGAAAPVPGKPAKGGTEDAGAKKNQNDKNAHNKDKRADKDKNAQAQETPPTDAKSTRD